MHISIKNGLLLLFSCLITCLAFPQSPEINIQHYIFSLHLNDSTDQIAGEAEVQLKLAAENVTAIVLDLVEKKGEKGMKISQLELNGQKVESFEHQNEKLRVPLPQSLQSSSEISLKIAYSGIPADGLIISKNKFGDRTFFGDNWPNRAHHWLPCVDHPADKASVEFIVHAPEYYEVVANGEKIEESSLNNGYKRTHWKSSVILPTKVMVIGVARFATQLAGAYKGIPVSTWVYPQDRDKGFYDYAVALPVLTYFESKIGEYPYVKLANVQSKTRYGGMENASCIFYAEASVTGDRSCERLVAHEVAHQWFGNSASEKEWFHVWLSEGFATYFTHLYIEETYGREVMIKDLLQDRARVLMFHKLVPRPIVDTTITDLNDLLNPNSYQKGGWVLHMLRYIVGEKAFWEGIQNYYADFQLGNALTGDLQRVMEETSGKDLARFFDQWIFRAGHPVYQGKWKAKKKKVVLTLAQEQEQLFDMPLEVGIYLEGETEPQIEQIQMSTREATFTFSINKKVEKVVLDPNIWVLMEKEIGEE